MAIDYFFFPDRIPSRSHNKSLEINTTCFSIKLSNYPNISNFRQYFVFVVLYSKKKNKKRKNEFSTKKWARIRSMRWRKIYLMPKLKRLRARKCNFYFILSTIFFISFNINKVSLRPMKSHFFDQSIDHEIFMVNVGVLFV